MDPEILNLLSKKLSPFPEKIAFKKSIVPEVQVII